MNTQNWSQRPHVLSLLTTLFVVSIVPSYAQENEGLEEIIVTAQKVEQNLEDVPSSVSVVPGALIEESGANNISDLNGVAPNVILQDMVFIKNTANMAIRGIGFFDTDPFADQKTQVLIDGIPHARVTGLGHDQIDVERVEILRGPQGTLFGRNSLAGTINIITRAADQEAGIAARATVGDFGLSKYVVSAESGEILNDSLRTRVTLSKRSYDGHVTNAFSNSRLGAQDSSTLRLKLDHSLSNLSTTLTYYQVDEETDGIATSNVIQDPYGTSDGDVHLVNMDTDGFNESNESGFTFLSDIEFEPGTVYVAANSHDSDFLLYTDLDGRAGAQPPARGPNPRLNVNIGFDIDHGQDSFEIRFHDAHSARWDYVVGMFAFQESARRFFYQNIGPPFSATFAFEDAARTTIAEQETKSVAAFAQTDFRLSDQFILIAGGRITQDEKQVTVSNFGLPAPAPQRPPIVLNAKTTWDQPTWKLGTKYEHSDSLMGYATISTGYKSGGFTSRATVPENVGPYDAEYVTNYESGLKANLLQNHLRLSAAVFYSDYEDLVGFVRRTNSTGRGNEPINENLGNVDIRGFEFESDWLLQPNLSIDFALGLLDAAWDTFMVDLNNDGRVTDNSDLDVLMAPSLTAYGAVNYTSYIRESTFDYRLEARYQSRYNSFGESNDAIFYRPGTTLINGSIKWSWGARDNSVSVFGRNLTDKGVPKLTIGASIFPVAVYEAPRTLGLELRLNL
ncbi:MAG: TonB-dependent receptor [Gammaproteobacteria bacterium]|nr:TonB-dependent receptor [Gammaproteobacteria bacterium]